MNEDHFKLIKRFSMNEVLKCCRGLSSVDQYVIMTLDEFTISLGPRSKVIITEINMLDHSAGSRHFSTPSEAVDFRVDDYGKHSVNEIVQLMLSAGFRGVGYYPEYLPNRVFHGDLRCGKIALWRRDVLTKKYVPLINA